MKNFDRKLIFVFAILLFLGICLLELKAIYWGGLKVNDVFSGMNLIAFLLYFLINGTALLFVVLYLFKNALIERIRIIGLKLGWIKWALTILVCFYPDWLFLYSSWGSIFLSSILRIWIFTSVLLLITFLFDLPQTNAFTFKSFFISLILVTSIFLLTVQFKDVINYPFSLYWSEGNRFWDYSTLFARSKYMFPANQPIYAFIEIGRQSLWGLPFLLTNPSIALMRLWNAILFTLPYILLGILILRKKKVNFFALILGGLWVFLFLNQGPIYTPLVLSAILVVLAVNLPVGWAAILVIFSGYYANLARFTWSFAPAIWIGLLCLFNFSNLDKESHQINWPRTIFLTMAGFIGGFILPMFLKVPDMMPLQVQESTISSTQATIQNQSFLWTRLFPNPTYPPGILLGLAMAALPLIVLLIIYYRQSKHLLGFWKKLGILSSCIAFLAVGLIISIKIGGGSNLHNLDMFFINLLFIMGIAWKSGADQWLLNFQSHSLWVNLLLIALIVFPTYSDLLYDVPRVFPTEHYQQNVIKAIQTAADEAKKSGAVLFIDQRQLLAFGNIKGIPLVVDYEKKYLMNEAMSNDQALFDQFYKDLKAHRFSLIVNEPIFIDYQTEDFNFGTENDVWVNWVSKPLLCFYQPLETYKNMSLNVELLVPRTSPPDPLLQCPPG